MLYSPEMVSLLHKLRSRILSEFGVKIRLVDPELLALLADLASKSRDSQTRDSINRVLSLAGLGGAERTDETAGPPEPQGVIYRGVRLSRAAFETDGDGKSGKSGRGGPSGLVYRGQRVHK